MTSPTGFDPDQWSLEDAPSLTGDTALVDLRALPAGEGGGILPAYCEIETDDGRGPTRAPLRMWLATRHPRLIRLAPDRETRVRLRMIWGRPGRRRDDPMELEPGPWSDPKAVRPSRGAPALRIEATRRTAVAPAGIMFTAEALGLGVLRPYHEIRYLWRFGDPGLYRNLSPDLPWPPDRDIAFGPVVAHTFEAPGTYTITCEATDGVTTLSAEIRVEIEDPDIAFPGSRTVCVSQAGDFTGAPPGSVHVGSMARARSSLGRGGPARILLRRGEEFRETGEGRLTGFETFQLGAFGPGPSPVWRNDGTQGDGLIVQNIDGDVAIWGLDMQGPYDAGRPENTIKPDSGIVLRSGRFRTVHDCRLSGWSTGIYLVRQQEHVVITDCAVTNWFNFGVFLPEGGWVGLAGCSVRQSPFAPNDAGRAEDEPPFVPDHGPYRLSRPTAPCCFNLVDLFSCNSWYGTAGHQPCIRWNSGGVTEPQKLNIDRARTEGGNFTLSPGSAGAEPFPHEILLDKFHHVPTAQPTQALNAHSGGTTIRNGIIVQGDYPAESNTGLRGLILMVAEGANALEPSAAYNCTLVDLRRPANATNSGGASRDFTPLNIRDETGAVTSGNHVLHAPLMEGGTTADMPLDTASRWQPLYLGRRILEENGGALQSVFANPPEAGALFGPLPGSPAIGDADPRTPIAIDDFFGRMRGERPSRGALEPD